MDLMNGIAAASMDMSAAKLQYGVSLAMAKKVMDTQELAAQELLKMLPQIPGKGAYIDTYA